MEEQCLIVEPRWAITLRGLMACSVSLVTYAIFIVAFGKIVLALSFAAAALLSSRFLLELVFLALFALWTKHRKRSLVNKVAALRESKRPHR